MSIEPYSLYDEAALLERLSTGVQRSNQPVMFLVGSGLTAPTKKGDPGVPGVSGVIDLIRAEFGAAQQMELEKQIDDNANPYQAAFSFLLGRRGQQAANHVIRQAVWQARSATSTKLANSFSLGGNTPDDVCRSLDTDLDGWSLTPGVDAIGGLIARYPDHFGRAILTTNFDPLLAVAIARHKGNFFRTVLHRDGNLGQTEGSGCHIIHLHGYWYGADTLHTPRQLSQSRPRLKASLSSLLKAKTIVVSAYGGWDDVFTDALMEVVLDDNAYPEIIWTFNATAPQPDQRLVDKLTPGIDRGRVTLYAGINCQTFFPSLLANWEKLQPTEPPPVEKYRRSTELQLLATADSFDDQSIAVSAVLEGGEEDRPPKSDVCVGREKELDEIITASQRACFITGFGGQGKSTIAAMYFANAQENGAFDLFVWRDCKEEGERFENQLIDIIVRLSEGASSANELSQQRMEMLAELLAKLGGTKRILFVFDNVDHYVDLENQRLTGNADAFLTAFLNLPGASRLVFTCRPDMRYHDDRVLTLNIGGLDIAAAMELFVKRDALAPTSEIRQAHKITNGHAFWLDLIAAQTAKKAPELDLRSILDQIVQGSGTLPASTLSTLGAIWQTLHDRQKIVLQTMAETVRPETVQTVGDYLSGRINFNQVNRAVKALRDLNLIVVKPRRGSEDLLELHPLVREFIKRTFPLQERLSFIDAIIQVYLRFMGIHKAETARSHQVLEHWTENAELYVEAGKLDAAFDCLAEVGADFYKSAAPGEFARAARILFRAVSWSEHASYKRFDQVFTYFFKILVNLGRSEEYQELIERYHETVPSKDVRYINYCDLRCMMHWTRMEFKEAIEWGEKGKNLKDKTDVDTQWSTNHNLALAQRDFGQPDIAMLAFLRGTPIEKLIDPEEFDDERDPSFYGNIGRCLHLMGQIDPALICYRKSALLLQKDRRPHVENQGFVRSWIGELLLAKGDLCSAKAFFQAAKSKWRFIAPQRVSSLDETLRDIESQTLHCVPLNASNSERYVLAWINEREHHFEKV
jgi:tetratricopeptide (TPR) repeat protein